MTNFTGHWPGIHIYHFSVELIDMMTSILQINDWASMSSYCFCIRYTSILQINDWASMICYGFCISYTSMIK